MFQRIPRRSRFTRCASLRGVESLELRRVLDCQGFANVSVCVAGDSDENGQFDEQDIVLVQQANKYLTGEPASWREGDWNRDGVFDQFDFIKALQDGTYRRGELVSDLSEFVERLPANMGPMGPPLVIASAEQLRVVIMDSAVQDTVARAVDWTEQKLLFFSWSGSGGDQLVAEPRYGVDGTQIDFQFRFGLTDDYRPHNGLFAVSRDTVWNIHVEQSSLESDKTTVEFLDGESQFVVTGGIAGVEDEYRVEGQLTLQRHQDGTATFSQVDATIRGDGLSSFDGRSLDAVLNLTGLSGLQIWQSTVVFSGFDSDGQSVVRLNVTLSPEGMHLFGGSSPPCCDFFQFHLDANTRVVDPLPNTAP